MILRRESLAVKKGRLTNTQLSSSNIVLSILSFLAASVLMLHCCCSCFKPNKHRCQHVSLSSFLKREQYSLRMEGRWPFQIFKPLKSPLAQCGKKKALACEHFKSSCSSLRGIVGLEKGSSLIAQRKSWGCGQKSAGRRAVVSKHEATAHKCKATHMCGTSLRCSRYRRRCSWNCPTSAYIGHRARSGWAYTCEGRRG